MSTTATADDSQGGLAGKVGAPSADGRILLGEDVEIHPARERPELASPGTAAFEAKDRRQMGEQFALLCGRATVPRVTSVGSYKNLKNPHILKLVDAGIVHWAPENRQRFALVFDRPPQKKLMSALDAVPHHLGEDRIVSTLIQPILSVLSDLRNIDLVHGAVNPMNIFLSGVEGAEMAMLGECLSAAPSFALHPLFEPADRAMAQATGRGPGTVRDDLYAFGVCVAMAARGQNLLAGKTAEQIVRAKVEQGTYSLLVGGERIPGGISEFLRGVLNEDPGQRWDIDEALRWLEGRRLSPKQPKSHLRAARPFVFRDEKYWDLRAIADAFSRNVAEAGQVIEQDQFDLWIKRNFEDKLLLKRLETVWEKEQATSRERLVTSACMALDPQAPVRYKGLSILPSGFGGALADAMAKGEDIQVYGELLAQQFFSTWINMRFEEIVDATGLASLFEKCRNFLTQKIAGYGMERVLYTLNKECVCMSPLLRNHFVMSPGRLLLALEDIARQAGRPDNILDRHMIAFISVREAKMVDPFLGHITSHDRGNQIIGVLRTLAAIQKRFATGPVPGVASWIISLAAPAVERFNDHDLRKEVGQRLERLGAGGNLGALLELLDDGRVVQDDTSRYAMARMEYAALSQEAERIESYLRRRRSFGHATGRQIAMLVSAAVSFLIILGYLGFYVMQKVN